MSDVLRFVFYALMTAFGMLAAFAVADLITGSISVAVLVRSLVLAVPTGICGGLAVVAFIGLEWVTE